MERLSVGGLSESVSNRQEGAEVQTELGSAVSLVHGDIHVEDDVQGRHRVATPQTALLNSDELVERINENVEGLVREGCIQLETSISDDSNLVWAWA